MMIKCLGTAEIQNFIFPIDMSSFRSGQINGVRYAGYLLLQEGCKLETPLSDKLKSDLAISLFTLHNNNIIHGDPRIQNALLLDGVIKWIDFREIEVVTTKVSLRRDVHLLCASLGMAVFTVDSFAYNRVELYVDDPSVEKLQNILRF